MSIPMMANSSKMDNSADAKPRIVPGLVYVQNPPPWWVPRGLESTQGPDAKPPPYRMISYSAEREYSENEGWQTQMSRHQRRLTRHRNRVFNDEYNFDDDVY
jgi:hypothetical protein